MYVYTKYLSLLCHNSIQEQNRLMRFESSRMLTHTNFSAKLVKLRILTDVDPDIFPTPLILCCAVFLGSI